MRESTPVRVQDQTNSWRAIAEKEWIALQNNYWKSLEKLYKQKDEAIKN